MKLSEALEIYQEMMVAFVGCGGKTSIIEALIHEFKDNNSPIIHTTTTKIFPPLEREVVLGGDIELHIKAVKNSQHKVITLGQKINEDQKLVGIPRQWLDELRRRYPKHLILVEADGCKGKSIKLYEPHEPMIPMETHRTVIVLGMDAFTTEKIEDVAHRSQKFLDSQENKKFLNVEDRIDRLFYPNGLIEGIKGVSGKYIFMNKVTERDLGLARKIGTRIMERCHGCLEAVILGNTLSTSIVIERIGK